jgi:hypothetical protein
MWPVVFLGAWVGGAHLLGFALVVLGQHQIDAAVHRIGLEVLRPVHGRGAQEVRGLAGLQHDVGLAVEPVVGREWALAEDERQPVERAVGACWPPASFAASVVGC